MLNALRIQLLSDIAEKFSFADTVAITSGSPAITVPRDVIYCPINLSMRKRQEFLSKYDLSSNIEFPYISFYAINIRQDDTRRNKHLADTGIGEYDESADEVDNIQLIPCVIDFQIDHFAMNMEDDDNAVKSWLFWKNTPYVSFTDTNDRDWNITMQFTGMDDTSALDEEFESGSYYRRTFTLSVNAFIQNVTAIETIQTILWSMYNLDGTVTYVDEAEIS